MESKAASSLESFCEEQFGGAISRLKAETAEPKFLPGREYRIRNFSRWFDVVNALVKAHDEYHSQVSVAGSSTKGVLKSQINMFKNESLHPWDLVSQTDRDRSSMNVTLQAIADVSHLLPLP
jgi:hypothetical protein